MAKVKKTPSRILIANRGEIAVRIIRSIRDLGLESVAIYSDADRFSSHVRMADFAVNLPGSTSAETYLDIDKIVQAIKVSGADGVHPGYGFLSESDVFAQRVADAGAKFIGPPVRAMQLMGNKIQARAMMIKNDIPVVPGVKEALQSVEELQTAAKIIGYPMILKAAAGGGGRGMRVVRKDDELAESLAACQREAIAYFGNADVFCERFVENPRHIEFQVLFDSHGNGVHLFERDCSVQRRNQKLFEEAPSSYLNEAQRQKLGAIAVRAAASAGYQSAGTVEFICESPDKAYFMEMNTRIQVEHPVTEAITGIDLIGEQIRIARGETLRVRQEDLKILGWAMEARINAEDPVKGFLPSPGRVSHLRFPSGPFVRVDSHLYEGYEIPAYYDSMIAKLIVWGKDRDEAMQRMRRCLAEFEVEGVPTTIGFQEALLKNKKFLSGKFTTSLIPEDWPKFLTDMNENCRLDPELAALLAAAVTLERDGRKIPALSQDQRQLWIARSRAESTNLN
jgi:acetyl-CoA carboxylase biotin carboxylase subunit